MHLALIARSSPTRLSIWQRARGAMVVMGSSLQQVGSVQAKMLVFGGGPGGGSASGRLDKNHRCLLRLAWWVDWRGGGCKPCDKTDAGATLKGVDFCCLCSGCVTNLLPCEGEGNQPAADVLDGSPQCHFAAGLLGRLEGSLASSSARPSDGTPFCVTGPCPPI